LWATEPLYDRARTRIRRIVSSFGGDADRWEMVERKLDLERVTTEGFGWMRFPGSCVLAFREIYLGRIGRFIDAAIFAEALRVYWERPQLMPNATETLRQLSNVADLVLLTKGERWVQERRIEQSRLRPFFNRCVITAYKDSEVFAAIARAAGPDRPLISVGNSIASDVVPALKVGFFGVHIENYAWVYEKRDVPIDESARFMKVRDLCEVVPAVQALAG
jgi:putative hydrolase of the HAD superfamily